MAAAKADEVREFINAFWDLSKLDQDKFVDQPLLCSFLEVCLKGLLRLA